MSRKTKRRANARAEPGTGRTVSWLCPQDAFDTLTCQGYTSLDRNPEVCTAVDTIARQIASMTIH